MNGPSLWCLGVALACVAACIVDRDEPCGDRQQEVEGDFRGCVCTRGYVWSEDGKRCVACKKNEVDRDGVCACKEGFERPRSGAMCEAIRDAGEHDAAMPADAGGPPEVTGEGEACTTAADCADFYATFCQTLQAPSVCLIQGCATGERICPEPAICCSFSGFAPLESTNGLCVPAANCIGPGKPVTP